MENRVGDGEGACRKATADAACFRTLLHKVCVRSAFLHHVHKEGEIFRAPLSLYFSVQNPLPILFCPLLISTDNICNLQGGREGIIPFLRGF